LREQVATVYQKSYQLYGSPRVTRQLRAEGVTAGRRRIARMMR